MPIRSSLLRLTALVLLLPSLGGCYYYSGGVIAGGAVLGATLGAASTPRPMPATARYPAGALLVVDFTPPRDLAAFVRGEADSLRVPHATRIVGQLRETRGDTLRIAATELRREGGGPMAFAQGHEPVIVLPPEGAMRVHVITSNGKLAQRTLAGALIGALVAAVLLYSVCAGEGCYFYD